MTRSMPSSALAPPAGALECPERPWMTMLSIIIPLCMRTGRRLVGSPMMT